MGRRNKRQSNSSYEFAQRQNMVLDDEGLSFVINNGMWLVSLDCFNTLIVVTGNVVSDVLGMEQLLLNR